MIMRLNMHAAWPLNMIGVRVSHSAAQQLCRNWAGIPNSPINMQLN